MDRYYFMRLPCLSWNIWKVFQYQSQNNLTKQNKGLKNAYFTHFPVQMSVIRTRRVLCYY